MEPQGRTPAEHSAKEEKMVFQNGKLRWRERLGVLLFFAASLAIVYWPIASGSGVFLQTWTIGEHYPMFAFIKKSLTAYHELPLWMPNIMSGFPPFLAHGYSMHQPISLLFAALMNFIDAFNYAMLFYMLVTMACAFALVRRLGLSIGAGLLAASTYEFSQFIVAWTQSDTWANSFWFVPLMLYLVFKIHDQKHLYRYIGIGGAALAIQFIAGLIDITAFTMFTSLALAVYLDRTRADGPWYHIWRWRTTASILLVGIIGSLAALPSILPALSFLPFSFRDHGTPFAGPFGSERGLSISELPMLLYPHFITTLPYLNARAWQYVGTISLALGLWGIYCFRAHRFGKILLWLFIASVATLLPSSPLYWLIKHIPPLTVLNGSWKLYPIPILLFGIFAGIGFDAMRNGIRRERLLGYARFWIWGSAAILAGVASINIIWHTKLLGALEHAVTQYLFESRGGVKALDHYRRVFQYYAEELGANLSFTNPHFFAAMFFLVATALIFLAWGRAMAKPKVLAGITFSLVVANFLVMWQDEKRFLPRRIFDMPQTIQAIKAVAPQEPFRIAFSIPERTLIEGKENPSLKDDWQRFKLSRALGAWSNAVVFDLETIDGTDPFVTQRYDRMLRYISPIDYRIDRPEFASLPLEEKTRIVSGRINLFSMMNAGYLITPYELENPWKKVSSHIMLDPRFRGDDYGKNDITLNVYENPSVLPRAYFPDAVAYLDIGKNDDFSFIVRGYDFRFGDDEDFLSILNNPNFKKNAFVECLPNCPAHIGTIYDGEATARIIARTPRFMRIETRTDEARWLIVSDQNLPYWQTRIDGKPITVYTANYLYRGIIIPAGEHAVEFEFPGVFKQAQYALRDIIKKPAAYAPMINP